METPLIVPGRIRRNFGKVKPPIDVPYLIALSKQSYAEFLQMDVGAGARKDKGIQAALKEVFPIKDFTGSAELEFVDYEILPPEYSPEECREKGLTYEALMKLRVRLITYDVDPESETRNIRDIKEQEIFFGTVPLMTDDGSFIVNGTERVVVNQLQRSAGVFFAHDKGKAHAGKIVYTARIIPVRGSWLDFEYDHRGRLLARIDRRKNFTATTFLKAMGLTEEEILNYFYPREKFLIYPDRIEKEINPEVFLTQKVSLDIVHPETGEVILKKGRKVTKAALRKLQEAGLRSVPVLEEDFIGRIAARDVVDPETGEVIVACNEEITREKLEKLRELGIREV
ncbi:MAG TPA: DNA-directed RNA polymerase subunit beta, partial [Thermodesulfobacteriaceae bacterium]|nr:DNA-directed RNA polymerase subunit beta [Thermodesulfobacteriaceae bacterium]